MPRRTQAVILLVGIVVASGLSLVSVLWLLNNAQPGALSGTPLIVFMTDTATANDFGKPITAFSPDTGTIYCVGMIGASSLSASARATWQISQDGLHYDTYYEAPLDGVPASSQAYLVFAETLKTGKRWPAAYYRCIINAGTLQGQTDFQVKG